MERDDFREFEDYVRNHGATTHRLVEHFGAIGRAGLKRYVLEQYRLSFTNPQALAAAYACAEDLRDNERLIPSWKIAQPLIDFLAIEHWGSRNKDAHYKHFLSLASSLGLSEQELATHKPFPETREFTKTRHTICAKGPFLKAAGALALNEYANAFIFPKYLEGARQIRDRHGMDVPLTYFEVHVRDEIDDYERLAGMMAPFLQSPEREHARRLIFDGTRELMDARQRMYDGWAWWFL
jgi:hypothetical protein